MEEFAESCVDQLKEAWSDDGAVVSPKLREGERSTGDLLLRKLSPTMQGMKEEPASESSVALKTLLDATIACKVSYGIECLLWLKSDIYYVKF